MDKFDTILAKAHSNREIIVQISCGEACDIWERTCKTYDEIHQFVEHCSLTILRGMYNKEEGYSEKVQITTYKRMAWEKLNPPYSYKPIWNFTHNISTGEDWGCSCPAFAELFEEDWF